MISTQKMLRRNALLQKMLLLKCTDFLIEKKKINDELIRILTLITIYFLLVELETIKKKQEYYFIFIKRSSQFTPKFRDKAADPDLLMEVPHTISNKESPHLKAK